LNRQLALERHFYFVGLSTCCKPTRDGEDPSRLRMAPLTVLSPGPRLAGMPARGEERNDSNGRTGYEAENGSEWQSLAVFRQRVATHPACNRAADLRCVTGRRERARPVFRRPRTTLAPFSSLVRAVTQRSDDWTRVSRLKSIGRCPPERTDLQRAAMSRALQHIQAKIAARSGVVKSRRAQVALKSLAYNMKKLFGGLP
jgi:hypothetical protein